jgi:hypothetical protein
MEAGAGHRVAPKPDRIDTLKRRKTEGERIFGYRRPRRSKRKRGGRKPNDRAGEPRRGRRS